MLSTKMFNNYSPVKVFFCKSKKKIQHLKKAIHYDEKIIKLLLRTAQWQEKTDLLHSFEIIIVE